MLLAQVVETSRRVAETPKRTDKIEALAALLGGLHPDEIVPVVAYLSGSVPQGKTGAGFQALKNALASPAAEPSLEIAAVDRALAELRSVSGAGAARRRAAILQSLFGAATAAEQNFLVRLLTGELRQGALEGIMIDAIARASGAPAVAVRRAAMMAGDILPVARAALVDGPGGLNAFSLQLFRPVQPMLAQTGESVAEALEELGEDAAFEYKMDGARVQAHRSGNDVVVFSRLLNDVTAAVPEVVEAVRALPAKELILDGEVLAFLPGGRPAPFQTTMRRFGRRLNVEALRAEIELVPYWFDLLALDGAALIDRAQSERFGALAALSGPTIIPHAVTGDPEEGERFLREALAAGHEGVMAKARRAPYAAGARGQSWLKVKKAHTLDLAVLAAEWGHGRRRGWLSNLHLGARDQDMGGFVMLGKTFKGLTDEMLRWQTERLLALEMGRDAYTVYVKPELVVEVAFSDIQVSPRYPGGLALRFARVKRYRTDKNGENTDSILAVRKLAVGG